MDVRCKVGRFFEQWEQFFGFFDAFEVDAPTLLVRVRVHEYGDGVNDDFRESEYDAAAPFVRWWSAEEDPALLPFSFGGKPIFPRALRAMRAVRAPFFS